jgi:hypothetical protein
MPPTAPRHPRLLISLSVVLLGLAATASGATGKLAAAGASSSEAAAAPFPSSGPEQLALSRHLKARGVLFYGAWWCPACTRQKALFGDAAAKELPYIECDRAPGDRERCQAARIEAYPTWELQGKPRLVGVQSLEELKSWSGFGR